MSAGLEDEPARRHQRSQHNAGPGGRQLHHQPYWNKQRVMNNSTTHQPLSDHELGRLSEFLDGIGAPAMNMESLDGYFAALICGPDMVLPSEDFSGIWGEDFCFESSNQATDILGLLMRHWNRSRPSYFAR
jgi:hypothetical protein